MNLPVVVMIVDWMWTECVDSTHEFIAVVVVVAVWN